MDATRLHKWVVAYNWDDGLAPIWAIADWPRTEFPTALLVYWRLGGPWLEGDSSPVHAEAVRLQTLVRERLLAGFYSRGAVQFDPTAELTRVQLHKLRKSGVPELLLGAGGPAEPDPARDVGSESS
jgi:Domain of unknown function (DUF4274)